MNPSPEKILLLLDPQVQSADLIRKIRERFPCARVVAVRPGDLLPPIYRDLGLAEFMEYQPRWPLKKKLGLLKDIRKERFAVAVFVGQSSDLRPLGVVWASGAERKLFFQVKRDNRFSEKRIDITSLLIPALGRSLLLIISFPFLLWLRLIFLFGERGRFTPQTSDFPPDPVLPPAVTPPVSVVIPNFNGEEMLPACLPSVVAAVSEYNPESEIIVVDDASTDQSRDWVRRNFPQVSLLPLRENQGFGRACHAGIKRARSRLVMLLNNDIAVKPGFLNPLVKHFGSPTVFAVQPRAHGWDRRRINFGLNLGRMEQGYIRIWNEVDTGSRKHIYRTSPTLYALGGAILFDRRKYFSLGGFDPLFYPFRWEDIDLCYRAWKKGWEILYEPKSTVYHKHHGTLERVFTPDYLNVIEQKNELLFIWKNIHERPWIREHFRRLPRLLLSHLISGRYNFARALFRAIIQFPEAWEKRNQARKQRLRPDSQVLEKSLRFYQKFVRRGFRHRSDKRKQILIINPVFPYPPIDGGKTRVFNTIREISARHDLHLLCYIDPPQKKYLPEMKKFCRSVHTVDWPPPFDYLGRLREALFPLHFRGYYSAVMRNRLGEILKKKEIDLLQFEFDKTLYFVNFVHGYPTLYIEHDVSPLLLRGGKNPPGRGWRRGFDWLEWLKSVNWEVEMGRKFTKILALSPEDRQLLKSILPEKDVGFVQHGTEVEHFICNYRPEKKKSLIFVGSYIHHPNRDAILYFHRRIWPLIKEKHPEATLKVVGSHPDEEINALGQEPDIEVTGYVEDVRPHISQAMLFIAPMRKGRGMKGKVLEALIMAKPVVTTSLGIQGADLQPEEHLLVGDTPQAFAECVDRLFKDSGLRKRLACRGQELVKRAYDWSKAAVQMDEVYRQLI